MALTQSYCDFATGNDYKGATFTDGAYTSATKTLVKANAFTASKVNHWLWLESNDGGSIVAGYYRIATWTDASTVILATDAGAGVDDDAAKCTQHDGTTTKPWRSVQGALDLTTRDSTNGDQINVKAGTAQVLAASVSAATYGTPTTAAPLVLRGYTSSADDGGEAEINTVTFQLFAATVPVATGLIDLYIYGTFTTGAIVVLGAGALVWRCRIVFTLSSGYGGALAVGTNSTVAGSFLRNVNGSGAAQCISVGVGCKVVGCYIVTDSVTYGIYSNAVGCVFINNVVVQNNNTGNRGAIFAANNTVAIGNTIYSSGASPAAGINFGSFGGDERSVILNNIVEGYSGVGGRGIYAGVTPEFPNIVFGNAVYNCTTAYDIGQAIADNNDTLNASPFVNAANGDFDINGTVSGVTEDGWPSAFLGLASTSPKPDKGAVQAGAGSGGGVIRRVMRLLGG